MESEFAVNFETLAEVVEATRDPRPVCDNVSCRARLRAGRSGYCAPCEKRRLAPLSAYDKCRTPGCGRATTRLDGVCMACSKARRKA